MSFVEDNFIRFFRHCPLCSGYGSGKELLCMSCWEKVEASYSAPAQMCRKIEGISHYSLMTWRDQLEVSQLITSLKGGQSAEGAFKRLAQAFLARRILLPLRFNAPLLVPAPPRRKGQADHAQILAAQLALLTGWPMQSSLARKNDFQQKFRGQKERRNIGLILTKGPNENYSYQEPNKVYDIIFIDDVLTTGATALAAKRALRASRLEVWTLSYRPILVERA